MPQSKPEVTPDSVRTPPVIPSCPMCGHPLQGRQTVCSAKCRIARSRQKHEAKRREKDTKVRLLLTTVIETAQEAKQLLEEPLTK
jgi:predicted nucleic acid-binding Zn ribbon protein